MSAAGRSSHGLVETLVVAFLALAAAALGWLHWKVIPERFAPIPLAFDLRNPMVDAQVGECQAIETEGTPESTSCQQVVEPGVVLRPDEGPARLPGTGGLRRSRPYLVCEYRFPPPGKDCNDPGATRQLGIYPLSNFGLPATVPALLQSIQPRWVERGGRYRFVYEVQMRRLGQFFQGPVILYIDPDEPVTGVVLRRDVVGKAPPRDHIYTAVDCR
jgi:hypothetical protein